MKHLITSLAVAACLLVFAAPAHAIPGFSLGVDVGLNIPIHDNADDVGMSLGGLAYASFDLIPMLKLTGRAGYLAGLEGDPIDGASYVPVLLGVKWFPLAIALYLAGELGPVWVDTGDDWESKLGGTFGAGFGLGPIDLRAALFFPRFENIDHSLGALLTAGYRF